MTAFHRTVASYQQGARTLPGEYYTSAAVLAEERERIHARSWNCVGRASVRALASMGCRVVCAVRTKTAASALRSELHHLTTGGTLLVKTDAFDERSLTKAGYRSNPLLDGSLDYKTSGVSATTVTNLKVNGARISSPRDVQHLQSSLVPGARLSLSVERGAEVVPISLNLAGR